MKTKHDDTSPETMGANARLMQAAPELLRALKRARAALIVERALVLRGADNDKTALTVAEMDHAETTLRGGHMPTTGQTILENCDAVIAKAEGGQS